MDTPDTQLDRRIEVIDGSADQRALIHRVSDLRSLPFVVLLGEPGIGKSTVFAVEAALEQVPVLKVRELMTRVIPSPSTTLFLDALDEYRIDGQPADKVHELARAMSSTSAKRWRLSCRSEDWRKAADVAPIQRTTAGAPIVVAQLLPLDHAEAAAVLVTLGERDPEGFLEKAEALGAAGFVQSPLSLRLLHKAVTADGAWPSTRQELFASSIRRLAYERNDEYKLASRSSVDDIIEATAKASLVMLVSGARAIWRSNDEPPTDAGDARAFLTAHDLQLDRTLLQDMLDTALFRGEGEAFEPMHRTIAEYLAGQVLARVVSGGRGKTAFPLTRAIALITGVDGGPPTELRGLYAWFAVHLAKLGDEAGAKRLVELDAVTSLAYGDAAALGTSARKAILVNLDRNDPYFRASEVGITAVGGLAGEDLSEDFRGILMAPPDGTHRMLTVLEALTIGQPVASLRPLLRSIALDPARPQWHRWRAAEAWFNGSDDRVRAHRELYDCVASEPASIAREELRVHLAAGLPASALSTADIRTLLADFHRSPKDNTVGRLVSLHRNLEAEPRADLFDQPISTWLPEEAERHHGIEVDHFVDNALAACIRSLPSVTGARLWHWTVNARDEVWSSLGSETSKAIGEWLDKQPGHDVELFEAILAEDKPEQRPWVAENMYVTATGRNPSAAIIRHVLAQSTKTKPNTAAKRLLHIAVSMARSRGSDAEAYWEVYDRVSSHPGCKNLLRTLTTTPIEKWRRREHQRRRQQDRQEAKQKARNVVVLRPVLSDLRGGRRARHLDWAANHYFESARKNNRPSGMERIAQLTDVETASAIAAGWEYLATVDLDGIDAAKLGAIEVESRRYFVEAAAVAGLDLLFEEERVPDLASMPIAVAIIVLRSGWVVGETDRRKRLEQWALDRLNLDPIAGAGQLLDFWGTALTAGGAGLSGIWRLAEDTEHDAALSQALDILLETRRSMPAEALRTAVRIAAKHLQRPRLHALCVAALDDPAVVGPQRTIWSFVAFALDPVGHGDRFMAEHRGEEAVGLLDEVLTDGLIESFGGMDGSTHAHREAVAIQLFGRTCQPEDVLRSDRTTRNSRLSDTVRRAINLLSTNPNQEAGAALANLIGDPTLTAWHPSLRHARAQQARLRRDRTFRHPAPSTIRDAIAGGAPVSASDLRAVVVEELRRLQVELHTDDTTPWKRYWNVDSKGKVVDPLIENECRDHLLARLRDRLVERYHIAAAVPEARRGEETRVDMLVLTGAGRNLPIEAKRHFHPDIWTAASTQLQGYTSDEGADGFGIYLVFWFGNDATPTPARPDGGKGPMSADQLETLLIADLSPELGVRTDIIVFDVSDPRAVTKATPRRRRTSGAIRATAEADQGVSGQPK